MADRCVYFGVLTKDHYSSNFFQNLQVQVFHSEVEVEGKVQSLEGYLDCFECAKA